VKNITIRDVARKAGVSYVTVSNVINSKGRMSEKTKKRVLSAIRELDFYPDITAATLSKGRSDTVAFVSSYLSSPFVSSVLSGMEGKLYETGKFKHSIEHYATRGADAIKTDVIRNLLYGKRAGAAVLLTIKIGLKLMREFVKRKVPVVLVESRLKSAHSVRVDNFQGAYKAVEYLIKSGRKRIVMVSGAVKPAVFDQDVSPAAVERLDGFKKAAGDYGIKTGSESVLTVDYYNREEGERVMAGMMKGKNRPDAIFCAAGDMVAAGIMGKAEELGIKIPADAALIGYDDINFGRVEEPVLTTVRQPLFEMGEAAFETAVAAMEGKLKKPVDIILKPELVIRKTA